jgi:cation:H+ antiporter
MFLSFVLLFAGFVILIKGADFLVSGSSSVAKRFNISNLAIGLTVVAFGTSTPELLVNIMAATNGHNDAAFGNVIGSNLFNVLLILGVAGLISPLAVQRNTVAYEVPVSLFGALLVFFLVNDVIFFDAGENMLSRPDALVLLVCFAAFMVYVAKSMKPEAETEESNIKIHSTSRSIVLILLGLGMLIGGGNLVVENAVSIATAYGLSEKLIGLTILAAGTSLPELATSAVAALRRNTDIAIGNVIGSNIFNLFFVLGTTGVVQPSPYNTLLNTDLCVLGISTVVLMVFMFTINRRRLDRWEALLLLAGYVAYMLYLAAIDKA